MMWALVVTVCLAAGHNAECRTWTSAPMAERADCAAMMQDVAGPVAMLDPLHVGARCVMGVYS